MASFGASQLTERLLETVLRGEVQPVLIVCALVQEPRALLLDKPSAGLDMASRRQLLESLREIAGHGITLLLVTHHVEEILAELGPLVLLREGRVLQQGSKAGLLTDGALSATFSARVQATRHGDDYATALG